MISRDHVRAVAAFGFTERQAGFLVMVMLYSGVCVGRQYCTFAQIRRGQVVRDFFKTLLTRRYASAYTGRRQARMYHLHHKALYRAVGQVNNRHRRPVGLGRAVERLMIFDAVLGAPEVSWLATEQDKLRHFSQVTPLRREELPQLVFGVPPACTARYFPDKLPIGITADRRTHIFLYLVTRAIPIDFRAFLHGHAELLRALPDWVIQLLIPGHLHQAVSLFRAAVEDEFSPLSPGAARELHWYFLRCRTGRLESQPLDSARLERAAGAFSAPRFRALYRAWLRSGDRVLDAVVSPVLAEALSRGRGRVDVQILPHDYHLLAPLAGTS